MFSQLSLDGWRPRYELARDLGQIVDLCIEKDGLGFQIFNAVNENIVAEVPTAEFLGRHVPIPVTRAMDTFEGPISNRKLRDALASGKNMTGAHNNPVDAPTGSAMQMEAQSKKPASSSRRYFLAASASISRPRPGASSKSTMLSFTICAGRPITKSSHQGSEALGYSKAM